MGRQPLAGQGLLIIDGSRSHSDTPYPVGFLCKGSARRRDLYLTIFEPKIPLSRRPQTHASQRAAIAISNYLPIYEAQYIKKGSFFMATPWGRRISTPTAVAYRGGWFGVFKPPPPRNSEVIGEVLDRVSKKNRLLDFLL